MSASTHTDPSFTKAVETTTRIGSFGQISVSLRARSTPILGAFPKTGVLCNSIDRSAHCRT